MFGVNQTSSILTYGIRYKLYPVALTLQHTTGLSLPATLFPWKSNLVPPGQAVDKFVEECHAATSCYTHTAHLYETECFFCSRRSLTISSGVCVAFAGSVTSARTFAAGSSSSSTGSMILAKFEASCS